ncbi:restriction endonuclease [uncultured Corynebacterium sp.]|uniref:restriction endonuclease n=1 Tax=uncultured Corynebacterium sp. TaxID=159447 RepID=UPI003435D733
MSHYPWHYYMVYVLKILSDGSQLQRRELIQKVADAAEVSEEQRQATISSGQPVFQNRIGWAISYLHNAQAVTRPRRAVYEINDFGRDLLSRYPGGISEPELREEFSGHSGASTWEQIAAARATEEASSSTEESVLGPEEQIDEGVDRIHENVSAELLLRLHSNDPEFFEQAVLDVLIAMGYGGTQGKASRTQLTNDGGIDGVIDQDALGLSRIYVQAKRFDPSSSVGRPLIQAFVGALQGAQADRGVFFTTGTFSKSAREYATGINTRVVLIDGVRLAGLMIKYGVGVQNKRTVSIVEIDEDYFE